MTNKEILENIKKDEREVRYYKPLTKDEKAISIFEKREGDPEKPDEPDDKDEYLHVTGKSAGIGNKYVLYPKGFMGLTEDILETIDKGAFDECDFSDVVMNVNHGDGNHAVARTRNKTLELNVTDDGLYVRDCKLKKTNQRCVQFYEDVKEGLLDRMSFRFHIQRQSFDEKENCFHIEKIDQVVDVSAVEFPANGDTSISESRSAMLDSIAEKRAEALKAKETMDEARKVLSEILASGGKR